ncbi:acyl-CoA dehydrogenase family protein [Streptosporangium sp. NBC_01810]|uniref:acyl-CoA dehydrogenase family protein n=1 Tax=Streptosporangium sp. NBC_01810 TaxID=2975951 RepID=UPI002DD974CB|nr:acyl-CoA dehydrogenase family protein [Streptosporangium sp. NBC_01810]WSA24729.1 acyl-CoA dehydrogenase family protein [Streptosporangium sp. NBC_01810]
MFLSYTDEQLELQRELDGYFGDLLTPQVRAGLRAEPRCGPTTRRLRRRLGQDGWLGVSWPPEFGGRGMSVLAEQVVFDAGYRAGVPLPFLGLKTVGPTLMAFGSADQKALYLPAIVAGEVEWAIGYSEPEAGSDLAALTTRAVRDGDEYVINGSKIFTTGADTADHIWLAARTGPVEARHRNLSVFIVPTGSPGFSATPLPVMTDKHTAFSFYENVRVPVANLVGAENDGWKIITSQLNRERAGIAARSGSWSQQAFDDVVTWAREHTTPSGRRIIDLPSARMPLARAWTLVEAMKLSTWRVTAALAEGTLTAAESSAAKVLATEAHQEVARLLLEVMGPAGALKAGSPGAELQGRVEQEYRTAVLYTFGGGNNEIQREIIAWTGLNLPRGTR